MAYITVPLVTSHDKGAIAFYAQYGFISLPDRERMFLPIKTIKQFF